MPMTPKRLALRLLDFHGGQGTALYSVGSRLLSKAEGYGGGSAITCKDWLNAEGEVERHLRNLAHRRDDERARGRKPPKWMTEDARGGRAVLHSITRYARKCALGKKSRKKAKRRK